MLNTLFTRIVDMSTMASLVILAVMILRLFLRRVPKIFSYVLWGAVLFRLLCPISMESPVGVVPEISSVSESYTLSQASISEIEAGKAAYEAIEDALSGGSGTQEIRAHDIRPDGQERYVTVDWKSAIIWYGKYVWLAGMILLLLASGISYGKLRRRIATAVNLTENIYVSDAITSPFVVGVIRPKIYLPRHLNQQEQSYILLHEQHHIRRLDPLWKMLSFLALTLHWFNPLVWSAFFLAGKDMEMSCDEAVIGKLGVSVRADYADSLLTLATGKRLISGMPLAFGEGDTGGRIRNLAKWKRPAVWILVAVTLMCGTIGVCLLTNRGESEDNVGLTYYAGTVTELDGKTITLRGPDGQEIMFRTNEEFPEELMGTCVMVRTRPQSVGGEIAVSCIEVETVASSNLEDALEQAVLTVNSTPRLMDTFPTASFQRLAERQEQGRTTVYGLAYFCAYRMDGELLQEESASHVPVAMTFVQDDSGAYVLAQYWEPRDGNLYTEDIRGKFPRFVWPDTQKYIQTQKRNSYAQAVGEFGRDAVIGTILEDIRERDRWADSFEDLMSMCQSQRELLNGYGEDTLRYCFRKLEDGNGGALSDKIMAYVCGEIMTALGEPDLPDWKGSQSGQAWFAEFTESARHRMATDSGLSVEELEERFPGSWFYFQYTGNVASSADSWGLSLRGEKITPNGMTLQFSRQNGTFPGELTYGTSYFLQKQENGTWVDLPTLEDEPVWTTVAYTIPYGQTVSVSINWKNLYGTLEPGVYRLGKTVTGMIRPGEPESYVFYLDFEI